MTREFGSEQWHIWESVESQTASCAQCGIGCDCIELKPFDTARYFQKN
jgi:hypothetical protein